MIKQILLWTLVVLLAFTGVVRAQDAGQPFAAVHDGVLTLYGLDAQPITVQNPANQGFTSLVWSPDGSKLAYRMMDDNFIMRLMVTDASGLPVMLDSGDLEGGFPVTFTTDGSILYISSSAPPTVTTAHEVDVIRIAPEAGAKPQTIGQFTAQIGCGGGSPLPGDWLLWEETGFGGNYLTLAMTDYGLLHSTGCSGVGLALLDLQTGEDKPIGADAVQQNDLNAGYSRAALSPDGKQVAALYTIYVENTAVHTLSIIDLATLKITDIQTAGQLDQIAWGMDGTIFFSTTTFRANLTDGLTADEKQVLLQINTLNIPGQDVSIHQIYPATGVARVIYQGDAYAIGRMAAAADGKTLLFSQIANMGDWIKAIADKTLNVVQDSNGSGQRALVPVTFYRLDLTSSVPPTALGASLMQFTLHN